VNFALNDGLVAGWEGKYYFNYWRPITAIQLADLDANGDTQPDTAWAPVFATPNNPDYPSTNSIMSAASGVVLASIFGDATSFAMTTSTLPNVTRSFGSFSGAADDVAISRVYAGIHFRKATLAGNELGRAVGRSVIRALPPVGPRP
jgi:membrane-associated phospholipid phosphatase